MRRRSPFTCSPLRLRTWQWCRKRSSIAAAMMGPQSDGTQVCGVGLARRRVGTAADRASRPAPVVSRGTRPVRRAGRPRYRPQEPLDGVQYGSVLMFPKGGVLARVGVCIAMPLEAPLSMG